MISRARPATWAFRAPPAPVAASRATRSRALRTTPQPWKDHHDPRFKEVGREILDDYAQVRDHYESPKNALVLAHGLLGFSEIRAPLQFLPAIHYWHGITDALQTLAPSLPIITPAFADFMLHAARLSDWYGVMGTVGLGTGAFDQLTTAYLRDDFNPATPDDPDTRYFSFGAATDLPGLLSPFRHSWRVVTRDEGPNDGLVSVRSSRWGDYRGTLRDVSHLDLINWTNRLRWETRRIWTGQRRPFNAVALYLDIADMLAKEGL
ncbi:lipase [Verticillium alfalfae VaMs.102]|uniref:Lipase n=1 Tax=Verticillium alfalfae (strain VaMs.102 / ATCC MYA-4576 / FGSC 10136) TaxID=526221 RepID=C9SGT0_VERA1|nr:lipase [Verticillium alfalfae VaMs.102]EEY18174.1 lipase [Verticillium alfalfae VaMs.102]